MKLVHKKRIYSLLLICIVFLVFPEYLHSYSPSNAEITTHSGIFYGNLNEYVFYASSGNLMSYLDWELKPVYYIGLKARLNTPSNLFFTISTDIGLPGITGVMQDFDWLNTSQPNLITNFSESTAILNSFLQSRIEIGYSVITKKNISIRPSIFTSILYVYIDGFEGYYDYINFDGTSGTFEGQGTVIDYSQFYIIPGLSLELQQYLRHNLSYTAQMAFSPFVSIHAIDNHYLRHQVFHDHILNTWYAETALALLWEFSPQHSLSLRGAIQYVGFKKGVTYSGSINSNTVSLSTTEHSGANFSLAQVSICYILKIGGTIHAKNKHKATETDINNSSPTTTDYPVFLR